MKREPKEKDEKQQKSQQYDMGQDLIESADIDPEFQRIARENQERYREAMKELAKWFQTHSEPA